MYQARYFPDSSLFAAQAGPNISYSWRSLLIAKDEVIRGFNWRIGDVTKIRILLDHSVPFGVSFCTPI